MEAIREYTMGIGAAAMACALILAVAGKGSMVPLLKLICGLILAFSVARPVLAFTAGDFTFLQSDFRRDGRQAAEEGKQFAAESLEDSIVDRTEAYVLSKAREMGLELSAEVQLSHSNPPVPERICLSGDAAPYERIRLSAILHRELGIPGENLIWS